MRKLKSLAQTKIWRIIRESPENWRESKHGQVDLNYLQMLHRSCIKDRPKRKQERRLPAFCLFGAFIPQLPAIPKELFRLNFQQFPNDLCCTVSKHLLGMR